jgi:acetyl esterase/lipase
LRVGEPPQPGEKIIYHIHGGGYTNRTAHPDDPVALVPRGLLEYCPTATRAFSPEYRLLHPGDNAAHPFPTALLDALAGYTYLVGIGFKEEDIVFCGVSSGGHLALALIRYLAENRDKVANLPRVPGALVLLSPWTDMSESFEATPAKFETQSVARDWALPTNHEEQVRTVKAFLGSELGEAENARRCVYTSSASPYLLGLTSDSTTRKVSFKDFPRTWLDLGESEILRDQIRRLGVAMEEDLGKDRFVLNECPGGVHAYTALDWYEPERSESIMKIAAWLEDE